MTSITCNIPYLAIQERPRLGKHGNFYDPSAKLKKDLGMLFLEARQTHQASILAGEVFVSLTCYGKRRFDLDNVIKACLDAANGVLWNDDVQVTFISARKIRSDVERMELIVEEVEA